MTMLHTAPPHATAASAIQRSTRVVLKRMGRLVNRWIAALLAERARQANIVILRLLSDRELKDMGLRRGDLAEGLAAAARSRNEMQQSRRS
jgi:hypothetical protein